MRVAIVSDLFYVYAGSERVVEQILEVFPQADVFAVADFLSDENRGFLKGKMVRTTFVQKLPKASRNHRVYLPLYPIAVEQFDLSSYDLVISSSHAVAKGVITGPNQLHICYCHSPARYAWDLQHQYLTESNLTRGLRGVLARLILHYFRLWDVRTAHGVDLMVANSHYVARRIHKIYGRDSVIIAPPIDVEGFSFRGDKEDFYLAASRMVPYKRLDLIVEAFSQLPDRQLVVIGDGPDFEKIRLKAGQNVQMLGYQPFERLRDYMQRAKAFVFAAEEDFGIISVEAQACGTPVIAFGKGGSLDTILEGRTGMFFSEQTIESLVDAIQRFEHSSFDPLTICYHAQRFSVARFRQEFSELVYGEWERFIKVG